MTFGEEELFNRLSELYIKTTGHILDQAKYYEKGKDIYRMGEIPKGIYYLNKGASKVTRLGVNGREVILRIAGPHEFIGYLSLLKGWSFKSTATCVEDSEVYFIPRTVFLKLLRTDLHFANGVIQMLCEKLCYSTDEVTDLVTKNVKQRLCTVLLALDQAINHENGTNSGLLRLKKKDIASMVGTVPETLSRQLSTLEDEGLIGVNEKSIELINRGKLLYVSELGD